MRSVALKLTLAFLAVGVLGAVLVGVFVSIRTQREFDRFIFDNSQQPAIAALSDYYRSHGSWDGLDRAVLNAAERWLRPDRPMLVTVTDSQGIVVFGGPDPQRLGTQVPERSLRRAIPIDVDGEVAGYLIFDFFEDRRAPDAPENLFVAALNRGIVLAALAATVGALLLGAFLARTLARPIGELTAATQRIARGELGLQVPVRTHDELGKLASSFNSMSADLEKASRLRRQMTADIAHDLRTPLSVILGYTEALSDGKLQATPAIAATLHQEALHLNHLIDDLRTLSLADAGELPLYRDWIAPGALLERAVAAYGMQAEQQGITLRTEIAAGLPSVNVDAQRMAQVLGNLVSNALRHTPAGGEVTLSASQEDGVVLLSVHDTGDGIPPEDLPHIFERFYRGDQARQSFGASGLGLSIAKSIVEAHGGSLTVASATGQGSTFTVRLAV